MRAPDITITGSPTDEEIAAVLAALCRASDSGEATGRALRIRAEESLRRWRAVRSTSAVYRWPRTLGRPG